MFENEYTLYTQKTKQHDTCSRSKTGVKNTSLDLQSPKSSNQYKNGGTSCRPPKRKMWRNGFIEIKEVDFLLFVRMHVEREKRLKRIC